MTMTAPVNCPDCGADALTAGFVLRRFRYQSYVRSNGKIIKSQAANSEIVSAHCLPCGARLPVSAEALREATEA